MKWPTLPLQNWCQLCDWQMEQWLVKALLWRKPWLNKTLMHICGQKMQQHGPQHVGSAPKWRPVSGQFAANARGSCTQVKVGFAVDAEVQPDLDRIEVLWAHASRFKSDGPWRVGAYSIADAMFAPVAARIVGYDLPVSDAARNYCMTVLNDSAFKAWRALGQEVTYDPFPYDMGVPTKDWPV